MTWIAVRNALGATMKAAHRLDIGDNGIVQCVQENGRQGAEIKEEPLSHQYTDDMC